MELPASPLISTFQLADILAEEKLRIIDGSWHMPNSNKNADEDYLSQHIKGAVRFDLDKIADCSTDLPHMVAKADDFAASVGKLGISHDDIIVIYDSLGLFSAARVWWNFKIMGAKNVYILDGGLPKWIDDGFVLESGKSKQEARKFTANENTDAIYSSADILQILENNFPNGEQIIDMRSADRFMGIVAEPRAGLRSGHIPNSYNLPFSELVRDGRLVSRQEIKAKLAQLNIDLSKPIISTCGSGVTAPIVNFALAVINIECLNVYDGSWTEWGGQDSLPIFSQRS